jgi:hypothetical protein
MFHDVLGLGSRPVGRSTERSLQVTTSRCETPAMNASSMHMGNIMTMHRTDEPVRRGEPSLARDNRPGERDIPDQVRVQK